MQMCFVVWQVLIRTFECCEVNTRKACVSGCSYKTEMNHSRRACFTLREGRTIVPSTQACAFDKVVTFKGSRNHTPIAADARAPQCDVACPRAVVAFARHGCAIASAATLVLPWEDHICVLWIVVGR